MSIALGVDIGGSHITAGWVDLKKAAVLPETVRRRPIDSKGSAESILEGWCQLLQSTAKDRLHDNMKIGIAMPGPFDYTEGVSWIKQQDKFGALYGLPVGKLLAQKLSLPSQNLRFINDAESYLQGEMMGGAVKDFRQVLGLTLGTGLGSAIRSNGRTWDADLWQMPFKNGIAEDWLSTAWFVKRYCVLAGKQEAGLKEILSGASATHIHQLFAEFVQNFADFLLPLFQRHSFEAVVLGGNLSLSHAHFLPALKRLLSKQGVGATICLGMLQEEAILLGSASQWKEIVVEKSTETLVRAAEQ